MAAFFIVATVSQQFIPHFPQLFSVYLFRPVKPRIMRLFLPILTLGALTTICHLPIYAQQDIQKQLQRQLITAEDGSVIELPAGRFQISSTLSLEGKKRVMIKG